MRRNFAFDIRRCSDVCRCWPIVVKKAYCDFDRQDLQAGAAPAAFELIEIPHVRQSGKNPPTSDGRRCARPLLHEEPCRHVVIISGDSDFSPSSANCVKTPRLSSGSGSRVDSDLFISNCDEFIYCDDLVRVSRQKRPVFTATATRSLPRQGSWRRTFHRRGPRSPTKPGKRYGPSEARIIRSAAPGQAGYQTPESRFQRACPRFPKNNEPSSKHKSVAC